MKCMGLSRLDERLLELFGEVIQSGQWTRFYDKDGNFREGMVTRLETWARGFFGKNYALATTSGTQSLVLSLESLDVRAKEVIVPSYSFTACAQAIVAAGATPMVAPIDGSMTLDVSKLEGLLSSKTAAVMVVHMRGIPNDVRAVREAVHRYGLPIIEDCSQFDGLTIEGTPAMSDYSDVQVLSFQGRKVISAGEGGLVLTNSQRLYERLFRQHDPAWYMRKMRFSESYFPFSGGCRMNEITAAVIMYQTTEMSEFLAKLRAMHDAIHTQTPSSIKSPRLTFAAEQGGTLVLRARTPREAKTWKIRLEALGIPIYPESANPTDVHFFSGWPEALRARCLTPVELLTSEGVISERILIQLDPNWSTGQCADTLSAIVSATA